MAPELMVPDGYPAKVIWKGTLASFMDTDGLPLPLLPCRECGRVTSHDLFAKPLDPGLGSICSRCGHMSFPREEGSFATPWSGGPSVTPSSR
jgi:hypothetical protein